MIFNDPVDAGPSTAAVMTLRVLLGLCLAILAIGWLVADPARIQDGFLLDLAFAGLYAVALLLTISPETGAAVAGGVAVMVFVLAVPLAALLTWIGIGLHDVKKTDLPGMIVFWFFFVLQIAIVISSLRIRRHAKGGRIAWVAGALAASFLLTLLWKDVSGRP